MSGVLAVLAGAGRAPLIASVSPGTVLGSGGGTTVTTPSATCTASGGSGTLAYAWTLQSGADIGITSPAAATTTFRQVGGTSGTYTDTANCTVTDAFGSVVATGSVAITIERF